MRRNADSWKRWVGGWSQGFFSSSGFVHDVHNFIIISKFKRDSLCKLLVPFNYANVFTYFFPKWLVFHIFIHISHYLRDVKWIYFPTNKHLVFMFSAPVPSFEAVWLRWGWLLRGKPRLPFTWWDMPSLEKLPEFENNKTNELLAW